MGDKKSKKKEGKGGKGKFLALFVVLVAGGGAGLYFFAPEMLQQGLGMVGIDVALN